MSLKAYNGMKCEHDMFYIQKKIEERIDIFNKITFSYVCETMINDFVDVFDGVKSFNTLILTYDMDISDKSKYYLEFRTESENENIKVFDFILEYSRFLAMDHFKNKYSISLDISYEYVDESFILLYPSINIEKHKEILLEFLDDYYCQNQVDKDPNINIEEWNLRKDRWYKFGNKQVKNTINIINPNDFYNSFLNNRNKENVVKEMLKHIPNDKKRCENIAEKQIFDEYIKKFDKDKFQISDYNKLYLTLKRDKNIICDYIKTNNIKVNAIDENVIINYKT